MREQIKKILELYEQGLSLGEICEELKLTPGEFNHLLKVIRDSGFNTSKTYSSDGRIVAKINKTLNFKTSNAIRINVKDRVLRAVFISDPHIGSEFERPDLLKRVINDYARNHGIHVIFNGGDVIENVYPDSHRKLHNPTDISQAKKVLRVHPYNKDMIYFTLYGNHDYKSIIESGFDIARYIEERRYDIVSLGYGSCIIHMKDDAIALVHDLSKSNKSNIPDNVSLVFRGHSHKSKNRENKIIYIPSLSDSDTSCYEFKPLVGFLDVEFIFFDKKIAKVNIKQLAFVNGEIRLANEETMVLQPGFQERKKEEEGKKLTKKPNQGKNKQQGNNQKK